MGLWDFIKEAGAKLGIGSDETAPSPDALRKEVSDLGLDVKGLDVSVEGDKVKVAGAVPDQATREKVILAVGNVAGVSKVEDSLQPATAEPEATMYTVKKGDTLSAIAKAHYGDPNKFNAIFEANRPMLKHPDKIYPGQVLRIPPLG